MKDKLIYKEESYKILGAHVSKTTKEEDVAYWKQFTRNVLK